eukprot:6759267-Prymnesium_polylepis.1
MQYNVYRALTHLLATEVEAPIEVCETGFNAGHSATMVTPRRELNPGVCAFQQSTEVRRFCILVAAVPWCSPECEVQRLRSRPADRHQPFHGAAIEHVSGPSWCGTRRLTAQHHT